MSKVTLGKFVTATPIELAILAVAAAGALYFVLKSIRDTAGAAADAVSAGVQGVVGAGAGIATGNNVVTAGTPYAGTGFIGTVAAGENDILGGAPQAFGEWLGNGLYDLFHPNEEDSSSSSTQSATNSPFSYGTSNQYGPADDASPKQATFVASPGATGSW